MKPFTNVIKLLIILLVQFILAFKVEIHTIYLDVGKNIGPHVTNRLSMYLKQSGVHIIECNDDMNDFNNTENSLILSFGNSSLSKKYDVIEVLKSLDYESYIIMGLFSKRSIPILLTDGLPISKDSHPNVSFSKDRSHYGAVVGLYQTLELLGFGFFHPLKPHIPSKIRLDTSKDIYISRIHHDGLNVVFIFIHNTHWN